MANMIQNNFVGGEISPALYGRSDLQAYYRSCAKAENFVVSREGSLKKRRGIEAVGTVNHPHGETKIVPYIYDRDEAGVVIIYREGGKVKAELRSKDALQTPGAPVVVYEGEITADEIRAIRCSQIGDTIYTNAKGRFNKMLVINWANKTIKAQDYAQREKPQPVSNITSSVSYSGTPETYRTITYGAYIVRDGILSDVKSVNATFPTTWQAGASITVKVTHGQSLDNPNYDYILIGKKTGSFFGELARFYPEDVTEATVKFKDENHVPADMIYSQTNILGDGFHPPLVTSAFQQRLVFANGASMKWIPNTITMTTAATSYTITDGFIELISVKNGSTDVTSQCIVNENTITFPESAKYTIRYYQKIDTTEYPMTLWFSSIGNLYSFYANRPAADDDPFSPTLMSTGPSFIRWLTPYQKAMIAFTDAGIFAIAGSMTEGFSASTCQINKLSNLSVSQEIEPIETEAGLIFVAADNKTLYSMSYDIQTDATRPIHRMLMVKHLTRATHFTSIALQQFPDQVIWCGLSDGTFASFTFEKDEDVFAWSRDDEHPRDDRDRNRHGLVDRPHLRRHHLRDRGQREQLQARKVQDRLEGRRKRGGGDRDAGQVGARDTSVGGDGPDDRIPEQDREGRARPLLRVGAAEGRPIRIWTPSAGAEQGQDVLHRRREGEADGIHLRPGTDALHLGHEHRLGDPNDRQ